MTSKYRSAFAAVTPPPVRQMANSPRWPVGEPVGAAEQVWNQRANGEFFKEQHAVVREGS